MDVLHGEQREPVGPVRVAPVLHVSRDGEQLRGGHDALGGVDDDLVGRLERDRLVLAERERVQGAVGGILEGKGLSNLTLL